MSAKHIPLIPQVTYPLKVSSECTRLLSGVRGAGTGAPLGASTGDSEGAATVSLESVILGPLLLVDILPFATGPSSWLRQM